VVFALPPALIWSVYLLAFWPAVMSSDSIDQWGQLLSGRFNDWHPAFHSLTQWLLTRIVESPAVVAATQIAVLSSIVGWALASMRRLGMSNYLAWIISAAVALMPANGITVITLWKDVPYAIAVLAIGVIILREVDGRLSLLDKPWGWLLVGAVAALLALFHHAGVVIAAVSLATLGWAVRRKGVIGATLVAVVIVGLVQGGLYEVLGVERIEHPGVDSVVIHHIGAHLAAETPLTIRERSVLVELIPIPVGDWYDCRSVDGFVFHPAFSVAAMHERASEGRALWWSLFTRDPKVDFEHMACSSSFVWRIRLLPGSYWYPANVAIDQNNIVITIAPNEFGLKLDPVLPELTYPLARMISKSQDPVTAWLLWRGAVPLYLLLIGAAVASLRSRDWRYWIVIAPSGTVAAVLTFAAPTQDFRYMYPVFLSAMVLAPYLLFAVGHNAGSKALQVRSPDPDPL
jgi:hypothetical protein